MYPERQLGDVLQYAVSSYVWMWFPSNTRSTHAAWCPSAWQYDRGSSDGCRNLSRNTRTGIAPASGVYASRAHSARSVLQRYTHSAGTRSELVCEQFERDTTDWLAPRTACHNHCTGSAQSSRDPALALSCRALRRRWKKEFSSH